MKKMALTLFLVLLLAGDCLATKVITKNGLTLVQFTPDIVIVSNSSTRSMAAFVLAALELVKESWATGRYFVTNKGVPIVETDVVVTYPWDLYVYIRVKPKTPTGVRVTVP